MAILLGYSEDGQPVEITLDQLAHHLYMLGKSGMGKTSCLCNICTDLMRAEPKDGLCVIDPVGALMEEIKRRIPDHRVNDVILFEARDQDYPFSLNPFAPEPPAQLLGQWADHVMSIFQLICDDADWNSRTKQALRNIVITLLSRSKIEGPMGEEWPAALDEVSALLNLEVEEDGDKPRWRKRVTSYRGGFYSSLEQSGHIPVLRFWREFYDKVMTPRPKADISAAIGGAADQHLANPIVRNIVGQTKTKINFLDAMNEGKILLVDLSGIGDASADFLGSVIMAQLASATLQRERYAEPHFYVVADELYRYGNEAFRYISRQGRNFNVHLIAAQQDQTDMRPWQRGLMGNASNRVYFQLVPSDAEEQAGEFDTTPPSTKVMEPIYQPTSAHSESWVAGVRIMDRLERYQQALEAWRSSGGKALVDGAVAEQDVLTFITWALDATGEPLYAMVPGDDEYDEVVAKHICKATTPHATEWAGSFVGHGHHYDGYLLTHGLPALETQGGLETWMSATRPPDIALETTERALARVRSWMSVLAGGETVFVQSPDEDRKVPVARPDGWNSEGRLNHNIEQARLRGKTVYLEVDRQLRSHADVEREVANELTHLPRQHAKCKLAALDDDPPMEATIKTRQLGPENAEWKQRWASIKERSRRKYARPVDEVEEEAKRRDGVMRRAVETWHSEDGAPREYHADGEGLKSANGDPLVRR